MLLESPLGRARSGGGGEESPEPGFARSPLPPPRPPGPQRRPPRARLPGPPLLGRRAQTGFSAPFKLWGAGSRAGPAVGLHPEAGS